MGARFRKLGYVNDTYLPSIKKREAQYPTALPVEPYPIAIPHTEATAIIHPFIAPVRLRESVKWGDMPLVEDDEVALIINGLGATSVEELYILTGSVRAQLEARGIKVYRSWTGEYATSMEMTGASISICRVDDELKGYFDYPVDTPFVSQR